MTAETRKLTLNITGEMQREIERLRETEFQGKTDEEILYYLLSLGLLFVEMKKEQGAGEDEMPHPEAVCK